MKFEAQWWPEDHLAAQGRFSGQVLHLKSVLNGQYTSHNVLKNLRGMKLKNFELSCRISVVFRSVETLYFIA